MARLRWMKWWTACLLAASVHAQSTTPRGSSGSAIRSSASKQTGLLRELDSSLETVVAKVSPSVVQIVVAGYGPLEDHEHTTARITRQHVASSLGLHWCPAETSLNQKPALAPNAGH